MSLSTELLSHPVVNAVGWALVHFVWQGAAIAAVYAVVRAALRKRSANARYVTSCIALLAMLVSFVVTAGVLSVDELAAAATSFSEGDAGAQVTASITGQGSPVVEASVLERAQEWVGSSLEPAVPWLIVGWLFGVLVFSIRFAGGWALARKLTKVHVTPAAQEWQDMLVGLCEELRISRPVRLCASAVAEVPAVVGWLRPVILVPAGAFVGLTPQQIEAILAHELAHIRRNDYLVNLIQTAVETLLFYHPAVWWVSSRMRDEREHCCDDVAAASCGDVLVYARALADLESLRPESPRLAMAATGGRLLERIERLLVPHKSDNSNPYLSGLVAIVVITVLLAASGSTYVATAEVYAVLGGEESSASTSSKSSVRSKRSVRGKSAKQVSVAAGQGDTRPIAEDEAEEDVDEADTDVDTDVDVDIDYEQDAEAEEVDESDSDVGDFIGELKAAGYSNLSVDQLVSMKTHGVTPKYISELRALGITGLEADDLVAMRIHGVSPQFIQEMRALGLGKDTDQLVAMRIHGVTPAYMREMEQAGFGKLTVDQALATRIHGVTPAFAKQMADAGLGRLALDDLVAMRIHGVSPAFIKEMSAAGYANLASDDLLSMRIHGVNSAFVQQIKAMGFSPTADELVQMRIHGVTPGFIKKLSDKGLNNLTIRELIKLRIAGFSG